MLYAPTPFSKQSAHYRPKWRCKRSGRDDIARDSCIVLVAVYEIGEEHGIGLTLCQSPLPRVLLGLGWWDHSGASKVCSGGGGLRSRLLRCNRFSLRDARYSVNCWAPVLSHFWWKSSGERFRQFSLRSERIETPSFSDRKGYHSG